MVTAQKSHTQQNSHDSPGWLIYWATLWPLAAIASYIGRPVFLDVLWRYTKIKYSLNSRDLFLNLRRLVKMTKPLRFENKSLRLKYKCLICIWIIFWAILDLFINPKYLFQNKSFSQTYYFKSEKSFVILTSLLGLKINPGNLESIMQWRYR